MARRRSKRTREDTGKLICLQVPLNRGDRRAIANFDREFIPYRRCGINDLSKFALKVLDMFMYAEPGSGRCYPDVRRDPDDDVIGCYDDMTRQRLQQFADELRCRVEFNLKFNLILIHAFIPFSHFFKFRTFLRPGRSRCISWTEKTL